MEYYIRPVVRYELVRMSKTRFDPDEVVGEFKNSSEAGLARVAMISDREMWLIDSKARNKRVLSQSYGEDLED